MPIDQFGDGVPLVMGWALAAQERWWSVFLLQFLGEHHEDAAGAAEVGELVDVLVGGDAAKRVTAVSGGNLEGGVDVVDGETDAVHADGVRLDGLDLDRVRVHVLEHLNTTIAV